MRISDWSSDVCSSDLAALDRDLADRCEAALDPGKAVEARDDLVVADAHVQRHGDRRERVLDIVPPRHRQMNALDRAAVAVAVAHDDVEAIAVGTGGDRKSVG